MDDYLKPQAVSIENPDQLFFSSAHFGLIRVANLRPFPDIFFFFLRLLSLRSWTAERMGVPVVDAVNGRIGTHFPCRQVA